ncbi:MAG: peptidoglycan editing factor PgeF [Hyphomicrobiales bacterium]|nr:peptidoglycan editing factor PgeF [Hyphomicrobiales bacterium]
MSEGSDLAATASIRAPVLQAPGIAHAFFTRQGGVSSGVYTSLNGGVGSRDNPQDVAENRARMAATLGIASHNLMVPFQIHSAEAIAIDIPWAGDKRPHCDGLATATRGIGLGVTGADCGMILFADADAQVIGACHAGWKGALTGILEETIVAMEKLGASRPAIHAVLGPAIGPHSYEVGPEFVARFTDANAAHKSFFTPSVRDGHSMFNLPAFIAMRLNAAGLAGFTDLGLDTYSDSDRFYSYRRSVHRKEDDYGRLISAIALV